MYSRLYRRTHAFIAMSLRSDLCRAAVHVQLGAGDEAGIVRREDDDGLGELVRATEAAHDNGRGEHLHVVGVGEGPVEERGVDGAWTDDVDPNASSLEVRGPRAREGAYGGFRGRVDAEGREALDVGDGGVQDDGSAVGHQRKSLLHREQDALDVDVEGGVEMLFGDGAEGDEIAEAGVGEDEVEASLVVADLRVDPVKVGKLG